jgi:hypothetical protein
MGNDVIPITKRLTFRGTFSSVIYSIVGSLEAVHRVTKEITLAFHFTPLTTDCCYRLWQPEGNGWRRTDNSCEKTHYSDKDTTASDAVVFALQLKKNQMLLWRKSVRKIVSVNQEQRINWFFFFFFCLVKLK